MQYRCLKKETKCLEISSLSLLTGLGLRQCIIPQCDHIGAVEMTPVLNDALHRTDLMELSKGLCKNRDLFIRSRLSIAKWWFRICGR